MSEILQHWYHWDLEWSEGARPPSQYTTSTSRQHLSGVAGVRQGVAGMDGEPPAGILRPLSDLSIADEHIQHRSGTN
jgi:hypothetical protein